MNRPSLALVGDGFVDHEDWNELLPDHDVVVPAPNAPASEDLLDLLSALADMSPHTIAVLVGSSERDRRRPVEHIVRNVELFMVSARRELPGARMVVASILPDVASTAWAADANRHLRQFAPSVNTHYLDLWPALAVGQRPYAESIAAELRPALDRAAESPPMSLPIPVVRPLEN